MEAIYDVDRVPRCVSCPRNRRHGVVSSQTNVTYVPHARRLRKILRNTLNATEASTEKWPTQALDFFFKFTTATQTLTN